MVGGRLLPPGDRCPKWLVAGLSWPWNLRQSGWGSLNSNSETHMTAICDARLINGRGWISWVFICCAALTRTSVH